MTLGFLYVFYSRGLSDLLLRARAARTIPPRADAKQRFVASLGVQIAAILGRRLVAHLTKCLRKNQ